MTTSSHHAVPGVDGRPRLRLTLAAATIAVALGAAGCSSDDPDAGPRPATSSTGPATSSTTTAPPSSPATPSTEATATDLLPPYPGATPATGLELTAETSRVATPAEWGAKASNIVADSSGAAVSGPDLTYGVLLDDNESDRPSDSTDANAKLYNRFAFFEPKLARADDVAVAGLPAFHLQGDVPGLGSHLDVFGLRHEGRSIIMEIKTPIAMDAATHDATVGSIVASFALTA